VTIRRLLGPRGAFNKLNGGTRDSPGTEAPGEAVSGGC
jgi:hypothetical protein